MPIVPAAGGGCDNGRVIRAFTVLLTLLGATGCAQAEDPARAELRARLEQQNKLTPDEVGRVFDEINRTLQGKQVRAVRDGVTNNLAGDEREVVLGMLTDRVGVFDEGLRTGDSPLRVFNAPAVSTNPEIEAVRRLFVDVRTLLPRRFEFAYAFPSPDDYQLDLAVE
jgi:hypothetical protein